MCQTQQPYLGIPCRTWQGSAHTSVNEVKGRSGANQERTVYLWGRRKGRRGWDRREERKEISTHFITLYTTAVDMMMGETIGNSSLRFHPSVSPTFTWYSLVLFQPWTTPWIWLLPTSLQQKPCCSGRHQWVEWRTTSLFSHTLQVNVYKSMHQAGGNGGDWSWRLLFKFF